jgi:hypothetical protein
MEQRVPHPNESKAGIEQTEDHRQTYHLCQFTIKMLHTTTLIATLAIAALCSANTAGIVLHLSTLLLALFQTLARLSISLQILTELISLI